MTLFTVSLCYAINMVLIPSETEGVDNCALLEEDGSVEELQRSKTGRKWSPLHMRNPEYLELLRNRKNTSHDFIMENIVSIYRLVPINIV